MDQERWIVSGQPTDVAATAVAAAGAYERVREGRCMRTHQTATLFCVK